MNTGQFWQAVVRWGNTNSPDSVKTLLLDTMILRVAERNCRCEVLTTGCLRNTRECLPIDSPWICDHRVSQKCHGTSRRQPVSLWLNGWKHVGMRGLTDTATSQDPHFWSGRVQPFPAFLVTMDITLLSSPASTWKKPSPIGIQQREATLGSTPAWGTPSSVPLR